MDTNRLQKLRLDHPPEPNGADDRPRPTRWRAFIVLVVIVLAGIAAAVLWSKRADFNDRAEPRAQASAPIETSAPSATAPGTFTAAGYLEPIPPYPITVSALVAGRVDEFSVLEGALVKEGDVLAKLNSELQEKKIAELDAELAVNAAKLAQAGQVLARSEKLAAIGSVPAKALERAKADAAIAGAEQERLQATLDLANWQLVKTAVRAPVGGVVFERLAQVGEFVSPETTDKKGAAIATLYDPAKIQAWVDVNQRDVSRVKLGQRADLSIDAEPGKTYAGRVIRILPRASLQKNTVQVKVAIDEPSPTLRPDMSAKITFHTEESEQPSP